MLTTPPPVRKHVLNLWFGAGLVALGVVLALSAFSPALAGELFATGTPVVMGLVFIAIYVNNSQHRWAMVPAYFSFVIAGLILCITLDIETGYMVAYLVTTVAAFITFLFNHRL